MSGGRRTRLDDGRASEERCRGRDGEKRRTSSFRCFLSATLSSCVEPVSLSFILRPNVLLSSVEFKWLWPDAFAAPAAPDEEEEGGALW